MKSETKKRRWTIKTFDIDESTEAITKTYHSTTNAYIICAIYPKDDPGYANRVLESFSPGRVLPPLWWGLILIVAGAIFSGLAKQTKGCLWSLLNLLTNLSILVLYTGPVIREIVRGYIPLKTIFYEFFLLI